MARFCRVICLLLCNWETCTFICILPLHLVLSTQHIALSTQYMSLITYHLALRTQYLALGTYHLVLSTQHLALITYHLELSTQQLPVNSQHIALGTQNLALSTWPTPSSFSSAGRCHRRPVDRLSDICRTSLLLNNSTSLCICLTKFFIECFLIIFDPNYCITVFTPNFCK